MVDECQGRVRDPANPPDTILRPLMAGLLYLDTQNHQLVLTFYCFREGGGASLCNILQSTHGCPIAGGSFYPGEVLGS